MDISTLVWSNDMKLRFLLPHEPLRLCKILADDHKVALFKLSILYLHIGWAD